MSEPIEKDLDLWAIEDAAAAAGITRQRLNELMRLGRYPCVVVPFRNPDGSIKSLEDDSGRTRKVRFRLVEGSIIEQIKTERTEAQERQAEMEEEAARRRREPKGKPGRPKKDTPLVDAARKGESLPDISDLPL